MSENGRKTEINWPMFELDFADLHRDISFSVLPHTPFEKALKYIEKGQKVLDVACSWGYFSQVIKNKNCSVVGVEKNSELAKKAEKYCDKVIVADVEDARELDIKLYGEVFDFIVCLDILEHLVRPDKFICHIKKFLKPEGKIIASIPNIARFEYRLKMLFGKFDYKDTGALSKAHLRFFTEKTAKKLFLDAGLRIQKVDFTGLASRIKIFPRFTAFQFVIVATQ